MYLNIYCNNDIETIEYVKYVTIIMYYRVESNLYFVFGQYRIYAWVFSIAIYNLAQILIYCKINFTTQRSVDFT